MFQLHSVEGNDEDWIAQWGEEVEFFADYTGKMQAPWERQGGLLFGLFIIVTAIAMVAMGVVGSNNKGFSKTGSALNCSMLLQSFGRQTKIVDFVCRFAENTSLCD